MGGGGSKQEPFVGANNKDYVAHVFQRKKSTLRMVKKNNDKMSCYEQLESTFPLAGIDIREFEARIKRLVFGKEVVTLKQLQYTLG